MSDLRDLPDLARDVRDRVVTPPYDEVSRRVRARRLRAATGTIAAAVLVVGGVALWQSVATTAGPSFDPADPTVSQLPPTDEAMWRKVVGGTDSHPFEVEGTDDGAIAVVWRALEQPEPTFALVIREGDGTVHGRRIDEPVDLTPAPGGWVGVHSSRAWFITSEGEWTDLGTPGTPREARAGDVFVRGQYANWLYSPEDDSLASVSRDGGIVFDGYVRPDGQLVTCGGRDGHVRINPAGGQWSDTIPGSWCVIAGRGELVSAAGLGDDADGGIPLTGLLVSAWQGTSFVRGDFIELSGVSSVVVTPGGSTLVTDASTGDAFWLSTDRQQVVEPDRKLGLAFVAGDRLYATTYGLTNGPLLVSEDDGRTWQETQLPGNED